MLGISGRYPTAEERRARKQRRMESKHQQVTYEVNLFPTQDFGGSVQRDRSYDDPCSVMESEMIGSDRISYGRGIRIVDEPDPTAAARDEHARQVRLEAEVAQDLADSNFVAQQVQEWQLAEAEAARHRAAATAPGQS